MAERKNRSIMEAIKAMIHDQDLPMYLWAKATKTTIYVHNRIFHNALRNKTPKEMFIEEKPEVSYLKIFIFFSERFSIRALNSLNLSNISSFFFKK